MRASPFLFAVLAIALVSFNDSSAHDLRNSAMRFVPTAENFATPHTPIDILPVLAGDLICTDAAEQECMVANMPLLSQVDPRLKAPLVAYASSHYLVASGPSAGEIMWAEPQFGIASHALAPAMFAQNIMNNGCYITALTSLEIAALANVEATPNPRALMLAQIDANSLMPGGMPINRLQWQYRRWADKVQPNLANPSQPSSPDFLELEEFASDFPSGAVGFDDISEPARLNSTAMIAGMRSGATYLIAFQRYDVGFARGHSLGPIHLTLSYSSHHKIAVSGFQPGAYPLLINDVGNGHRYRVRLTTDLNSITFARTVNGQKVAIPGSQLVIGAPQGSPNPLPNRPLYLVYEGADGVGVGTGQIFIIEDIQTLLVNQARAPRPPARLQHLNRAAPAPR